MYSKYIYERPTFYPKEVTAMEAKVTKSKYIAMIVLQSILYGAMDVISKLVYKTMPVYSFLFLRYVLAAAIMLLIWHKTILRELKTVSVKDYLTPSLCMSCAFIFSNLALRWTTATNVSFLRSMSAILVPVLLLAFFHQKYRRKDIVVQILMIAGLYMLCIKGSFRGIGAGELFALIAALLVAGSLVFGKRALRSISAVSLSFMQTFFAIFVCGTMCILTHSTGYFTVALDGKIILALLYAAIACTIGGYMLQNIALKHISSKVTGMVQCLYPVATAAIAYFALDERLNLPGMLGAALIIIAILLESAWDGEH